MMDLDDDRRWMKPKIARVPKPEGGVLAAGGERVSWGSYWQRRARDGDIEPMTEAEIAAAIAAEEDPAPDEPAPAAPNRRSGGNK